MTNLFSQSNGMLDLLRILLLAMLPLHAADMLLGGPDLKAQSTAGKNPNSLAYIQELLRNSKLHEAEISIRNYLSNHEDSAEAHFLLGYTLFREDKPKDSLAEYTRASKLRIPSADDLHYVALDYVLLNDYSDADKWMTLAIQSKGNDGELWYDLGRIKYTESRFQEAVVCFRNSLAVNPGSVKAENNLGLAYESLGRLNDAIAAYRSAIAGQSNAEKPSEQPLINLASLLIDHNQLQEALSLLLQAKNIAPDYPKIYEDLGRIYFQKNEFPNAQIALEHAIVLEPENASVHFRLGQVYQREGKVEGAKHQYEIVTKLNGTHPTPAKR